MRIADALRAANIAQEHVQEDKQRFDPKVCQCCGYAKTTDSAAECVCAGIPWYMIPGGGIECQAHRFARAAGKTPKRFDFSGLFKR